MWPYTGEESRWLGRAEPVLTAPSAGTSAARRTVPSAITISSQITHTDKAGSAGWLQALDRLFKSPDRLSDHGALPLVAARLKDPLNAIRDSVRALRGNPNLSRDQQARHLDVVLREHEHLAEMISAMLDTVGTDDHHKASA